MLTLDVIALFFPLCILLALTPGPDNIFVLTQAALNGKLAGILVVLGLCTGVLVHTSAVALGVAAIFKASPAAFNALKIIGALYLLYLAWGALRAKTETITVDQQSQSGAQKIGYAKLYQRGIIMNVTNPKVSIFFLSFLPQFADPTRGSMSLQMIQLGGFFILSTILVFGGIALLAGAVGEYLQRSPRAQTVMNKTAGIVFIALAAKLATIQQ
ncbi:threonine transporter RhtB [Kiloniella litopenaei]|uniref:Threonine transporter RhtB n=1 Tax=Kiloniella litopenaei TaxID=1549748 RepID=A0A0M2RF83_9PROT|nr:LysE family translocator [Kiloniella litopenaei]KKJ78223.1 threonine transporter RhtB [Kiloniella litopenaei]